jgi:anthraniloyl-CoA monooxygenase
MKVAVVGGGPGGLYAALLIRKVLPSTDVTLFERNPAGATYGWGVVFSDRTLTSFREADYRTYRDITDRFVMWDAIDVRFAGEVVRCGGQGFSGIARRALLGLLQARCSELGVEARFETDVGDTNSLSGFDLVVAADGVHSTHRNAHSGAFGTRLRNGSSRYIWFGTPRSFDSFTFIFRRSEHGLFQVHAYPFDGAMSTFIVECAEDTWRRAGLDVASEADSISYCEKLFAPDLAGAPLLSNASKWISFVTVRNKRWRHQNIVLLGDAAHTAHFSIGSGTKLAMEDSIALANALEGTDDLEAALADYELERRPRVERFQEAARQSQTYFEHTDRYADLEPLQFVFHLLTRSGRVDYDGLRVRDASFVGAVDRWFARVHERRSLVAPPPAFVAARVGGVELANRVAVSAQPLDGANEGAVGADHRAELGRAAGTGAGLVLTEVVAVSAGGRVTSGCPGIYEPAHTSPWRDLLREVSRSESEARFGIRLGHSGRRGSTEPRSVGCDVPLSHGGWTLVAPSSLPYTKRSAVPETASRQVMTEIVEDFAAAARAALDAGFDALFVDMARGYLLGSFLSPLTNRRDDDFGGELERRALFPLEVLAAVRAVWPQDRLLGATVTGADWAAGGATIDDAVAVARLLRDAGCDLLEITAGATVERTRPRYDPYYLVSYSDRIRNEAGIATLATGAITSVDEANTILAAGRADVCLVLEGR